jgi:polysaccharide export outer membrane protein
MLVDRELVNNPQVSIFVEESVSRTVSVQGAVARPGQYPLEGRSNLLDLLGAAGGLSEKRGSTIVILRTDRDGSQSNIEVDAEALVERGDYTLNIGLRAGDIVMVPQPRDLRIYVTGAVVRPGPVDYLSTEGITVLQAITAAGGATERANERKVHIIRTLTEGIQERIKVNLKKVRAGKAEDHRLLKNDTVVVGEWFL